MIAGAARELRQRMAARRTDMVAGQGGKPKRDGIVLTRASRIEALTGPFETLLRALAPDDPIERVPVVAGHPGMREWLLGALARDRGAGAIVADIEPMLPSRCIDRLAEAMLGERAIGLPAWRHERLRWTIDDLLRAPDAIQVTEPSIRRHLDRGAAARRGLPRFELADRLARIYARHLVYRPDVLRAWQHRRHPLGTASERQLLAPLWCALVARLGRHRAEVVDDLVAALASRPAPWPVLHVFGVSHLAPSELCVLKAVARSAPVCVHLFDPSCDDWIGLPSGRDAFATFAANARARIDAGDDDAPPDHPHPLLARWGRLGQQFLAGLLEGDDVVFDVRDGTDRNDAPGPGLLGHLQADIRANRLTRLPDDSPDASRADPTLRIHVCHTRVRELEVLRDALLDAIAAGIAPEAICVMAPDIGEYAPLFPGVFGEPGVRDDALLPYRLADVPLARGHRLYRALLDLLALPTRRVDVPVVLDWLAMPEVRRRLRLGDGDVAAIERWLSEARVAWGLDADDRARERVPATDCWTFAWGVERLVLGYLTDAEADGTLPPLFTPAGDAPTAPIGGIHGPGAAALGALDALLGELARWRAFDGSERTASAWAAELARRVDALFAVDPDDRDGRRALDGILAAIAAIGTEPGEAGLDPVIGFDVVRHLMEERLAAASERQPFLAGGITVCGMVPQRAIPFGMIAVLGLDEGALPRIAIDGGLDPIASRPRFGDRDTRDDDRYLFLETLMAARERLHLSWIGRDERDGSPRSPSALLAELMATLDAMRGIGGSDAERPWLVEHPLQPFDARCFDGEDPRLQSFSAEFAAMRADAAAGDGRSATPMAGLDAGCPAGAETAPDPEALPLARWLRWFRDPMRELVERRLGLSMAVLEDAGVPSDEPLEPGLAAIERWPQRLLFDVVLPAGTPDALDRHARPALEAAGVLPAGLAGEATWADLRAVVIAGFDACRELPLTVSSVHAETVSITLGGQTIAGRIDGVAEVADGLALLRLYPHGDAIRPEQALHFGQRVPLFIEWALLRLARADGDAAAHRVHPVALGVAPDPRQSWLERLVAWDAGFAAADRAVRARMIEDLVTRLEDLRQIYLRAPDAPWAWFPRAAFAIANGGDGVSELFGGWGGTGELDYEPGHARVLGFDLGLDDPRSPRHQALARTAQRVAAAITLGPVTEGAR
jgi:exodeoxyribonuclease V gamma subunit